MWTHPYPPVASFNGPPRPFWRPLRVPPPAVVPGSPHFTPAYPSYPNSFCRPPGRNPHLPARFTPYHFQSNAKPNGFNHETLPQNINQPNHSMQYGPFQSNGNVQNFPQRDKKQTNQNQHFYANNKNQHERKNKKKPNKRDLPENQAFYCDICDRGFKLEEKLKEHIDGHEKCKEEGCKYVAAPKLVQLHVRNHHHTGLAKKIWNVESQEDVAKWIAERKKNFPTVANIEKKKTLEAERVARGEVLNEKQFYHRPHNQMQRRKAHNGPWWKKRKFNSFNEDAPPEKKKVMEKEKNENDNNKIGDDEKQSCDKKDTSITIESSDPLASILNTDLANPSGSIESNDPDQLKSQSSSSLSESVMPSSLKALQTIYNSDEDNENVNACENPERQTKSPSNGTISQKLTNTGRKNPRRNHKDNELKFEELPWHSKVFQRNRPTLLEKLLAKEIRHERNVILQCIRHIVNNNFFDKPLSTAGNQ